MWQNATLGRMMFEIVQYFISFLVAFSGGLCGAALFLFRLQRKCTSLEWAVGDLQQRASTFKGKEMAEKRWSKEKAFDAELQQALAGANVAPRRRYDNDPLGE